MQQKTQKIGGIAGLIEASLYIIGFVFLFTFLGPMMDGSKSDADQLAFVLDNKTLIQVWHLLIYVLFGIVLIPLTIAINEQFPQPSLMATKVTPIFGFIWSGLVIASGMIANVGLESVNTIFVDAPEMAINSWKTIEAVQNGLGGGVEIVGGLWVFLISITASQQGVFSKGLNYLGLIVGGAGILTVIPGLKDLGAIFGLTQIFWFIWIGISLLPKKS